MQEAEIYAPGARRSGRSVVWDEGATAPLPVYSLTCLGAFVRAALTPMLLLLTPAQTTFDEAITSLKKAMNSNPRDIADLKESIDECQSLKITDPSILEAEQLLPRLEVPLLPVMYRCYSSSSS